MSLAPKRANNRNDALLDAAADLFATKGFRETTMRDIAKAVGMLPGSIYYHHGSKDDLLLAVYESGVERFLREFSEAQQQETSPLERLKRVMAMHVAAITRDDAYVRVLNRVVPDQVPKHTGSLIALREQYEQCFCELVDNLPLAPWVDRTLLRLMILGAANHAQFWFNPNGRQSAEDVGQNFARFLLESVTQAPPPTSRVIASHKRHGK